MKPSDYSSGKILPFSDRHVRAVAEIELRCFSRPWSPAAFESELSNPLATYFVVEIAGAVQGFAGMHCVLDEGYITNIAVAKEHRGKGLAHSLLSALEEQCNQREITILTLEVRVGNAPAIALYKRHDFVVLGMRKNFYEEPTEDGYIMTKFLNAQKGEEI